MATSPAQPQQQKLDVAAKRALICYRQLDELLKDIVGAKARARLESYNSILETLKECFAHDADFADTVKHLRPIRPEGLRGGEAQLKLGADGAVLIATAHSFIELYLSPEDKKKAIGFHT
jgi:hypothetical protein